MVEETEDPRPSSRAADCWQLVFLKCILCTKQVLQVQQHHSYVPVTCDTCVIRQTDAAQCFAPTCGTVGWWSPWLGETLGQDWWQSEEMTAG